MKKKNTTLITDYLVNQVNYYGHAFDAFIIGTTFMIKPEKEGSERKNKKELVVLKLRPGKVL